ncbi:hypothetical protein [Bacillus piscicola]|uniref:hypothetical protein n=1 Tax=Bacillus piscicola TaxID=1632684 RepID=UPI001F09D6E7|nr:hypothetical protein [Bacillus piscicola]
MKETINMKNVWLKRTPSMMQFMERVFFLNVHSMISKDKESLSVEFQLDGYNFVLSGVTPLAGDLEFSFDEATVRRKGNVGITPFYFTDEEKVWVWMALCLNVIKQKTGVIPPSSV